MALLACSSSSHFSLVLDHLLSVLCVVFLQSAFFFALSLDRWSFRLACFRENASSFFLISISGSLFLDICQTVNEME